jgi:hypothetical protein
MLQRGFVAEGAFLRGAIGLSLPQPHDGDRA